MISYLSFILWKSNFQDCSHFFCNLYNVSKKSLSFVKVVLFLFLHIRYFWTKDGKAFDWILFNDRMTQRAGSGTLVIKSPREEDVGKLKVKILQKVFFIIKWLLPKMNAKLYTKLTLKYSGDCWRYNVYVVSPGVDPLLLAWLKSLAVLRITLSYVNCEKSAPRLTGSDLSHG